MYKHYHIKITTQALKEKFSRRALRAIMTANLDQDRLRGQIGHPEYHFDDNRLAEGMAYIVQQRELVLIALNEKDLPSAWSAFGRLTHASQDFYAHSNYVHLWLARHDHLANWFPEPSTERRSQVSYQSGGDGSPPPEQIDPHDPAILNSPDLASGRVYHLREVLTLIPGLGFLVRRLLPRDAHAWMNLDTPRRGPLFPYAMVAACKRTRSEFESLRCELTPDALIDFTDKGQPMQVV